MSNRILIVDDDEAAIDLLSAQLASVSEDIRGLTVSAKVVATFENYEPDLVLVDIHMPKPDGFEVLRLLREPRERRGYVPVIMLTADTSVAVRTRALGLGANDFLAKPFDRWDAILRARNLLQTRHLFQQLMQSRGRRV